MKKTLFAGVSALGLLAAGTALAADLPNRRVAPSSPVYAAPMFTWTGLYAGVNAGYGFGKFTRDGRNFDDPSGFVGGGQIGYNQQFGQFVAGVEADLQYADLTANGRTFLAPIGSKAELDYFGTIRGRLGVAFDRALVYATGGYAYGGSTVSIPFVGSDDAFHNGYTLGGGIEYAFTNNVTAKAEYLYTDLENKKFFNNTVRAGAEFSTIRAGVNYKF